MRRVSYAALSFALTVLIGLSLSAQDKQDKKKQEKKGGENPAVAKAFELPPEITLSTEQKDKLAAIKKELGPKLDEALKKQDDILTDEQKAARKAANKAAKDAGKKGKEAKAEVDAAMKLTEEQKTKMAAAQQDVQAVQRQIRDAISGILTDEQKAKLPQPKTKKKKDDK